MTVIKEPGSTEGSMARDRLRRREDVAAAEGGDHRAEFKDLQPEQMVG